MVVFVKNNNIPPVASCFAMCRKIPRQARIVKNGSFCVKGIRTTGSIQLESAARPRRYISIHLFGENSALCCESLLPVAT